MDTYALTIHMEIVPEIGPIQINSVWRDSWFFNTAMYYAADLIMFVLVSLTKLVLFRNKVWFWVKMMVLHNFH